MNDAFQLISRGRTDILLITDKDDRDNGAAPFLHEGSRGIDGEVTTGLLRSPAFLDGSLSSHGCCTSHLATQSDSLSSKSNS